MRVGIDLTCWSNPRGYGRFTRGLITALLASGSKHELTMLVDAQLHAQDGLPTSARYVVAPTSQSPTVAASASGRRSLRDLWAMGRTVARQPLDVLFYPSVYTYVPAPTRATVILGVHDVIAEDYPDLVFPDRRSRRMWAIKGWLAHRQADYVLTVSEHARDGIVRRFRHPPDRVIVVDEAPDPVFRPLSADGIGWDLLRCHGFAPGDRFLVYLGGINPHKNLPALVGALAELRREPGFGDVRLAIIGETKRDVFTPGLDMLRERIRALGVTDSVSFTGYLSDADAVHFLNAAKAVVLPSFAEGFGLPAVEGAACGTPVIATENSPLPRLLAGGGIFIDPASPAQLTDALRRMLADEDERQRMGDTARERVRQLTWERSAAQLEALLDAVEQASR